MATKKKEPKVKIAKKELQKALDEVAEAVTNETKEVPHKNRGRFQDALSTVKK